MHHRYGLPVALNAGNSLYFWPLEIIRSMNLPKEQELTIYRYYHRTLLRAHFGQALDVGATVDLIEQVRGAGYFCLATMELKTGALMAFALVLGAILGSGHDSVTNYWIWGETGSYYGLFGWAVIGFLRLARILDRSRSRNREHCRRARVAPSRALARYGGPGKRTTGSGAALNDSLNLKNRSG